MTALPLWPCALPACVLRDAWSMEPQESNRRTEMDSGRVVVAPKVSRVRTETPVAWRLTPDQFEIFKGFWSRDLEAGRLWFEGPLFDGRRTTTRRLRFARLWRAAMPAPGFIRVEAALETADLPQASAADQEALAVKTLVGDVEGFAAELEEIVTLLPGGAP